MLSSRVYVEYFPSFLCWLYSTSAYTPATTDTNVLGVAGYLGDCHLSPADLAAFMRKYLSDAAAATFTVVQVNGGSTTQPTRRGELQHPVRRAMAYPTLLIFYSTAAEHRRLAHHLAWLHLQSAEHPSDDQHV